MPPKEVPNFKVVGTKKFKLSELPVDNLVSIAKAMNKSIRAEHVEKSKQRIKAARKAEKVDVKAVKAELLKELKATLILTAKRKKAQLIADIMRNKKHIPKQKKVKGTESLPPPEPEEEPKEEKPKYVTKRIGGKIRRIPVKKLDEAAAKKKEAPKGTKENPFKKTKPNVTPEEKQLAKIGSTRVRNQLAARFGAKAERAEKAKKPKEEKPKEEKPKESGLAELKKQLKARGVPKVALKFIKTVKQAEEKLKELEEEEPEDESVKISEKVLQQIPMKNQAKIKKLVIKVLPRNEFTLQDQVDYFEDLKEMGENWNMSSIPRQRYDKFDDDEKLLFELLYPAIFDKKAKKKAGDAKRAERKAKGE